MKTLKLQTIFQLTLIILGITIGVYFSIKSNQAHAETHDNIKYHPPMKHGYLDISNDSIIPELHKLEITKDPMSGWNLHIHTKNFQFTPKNAGSKHQPGKGHAHLMINGNKAARIYSNWYHIPQLNDEIKEIEVTLNANTHDVMSIYEKTTSHKP